MFGFFDNGGGRCFVVNIAPGGPVGASGRGRTGLAALEAIDEVAIVAAPGYADPLAYEELLSHCERLGDRVAILDPQSSIDSTEPLTRVATATATSNAVAKPAESGDAVPAKTGGKGPTPSTEPPGLRPRQSDYGTFYVPWIVRAAPGTRPGDPVGVRQRAVGGTPG